MSLTERLKDAPGPSQGVQYGYRCKVDVILDGLPPVERDALLAALKDDAGWPAGRLCHELAAEGIAVSPPVVRKYRQLRAWEKRTDKPVRSKR